MALLVMAVYDTEENGRLEYTKETLLCLRDTVDWEKHRMVISDNGSCDESKNIILTYGSLIGAHVIHNGENLGTAKGVNKGLALRKPQEYCIKLDNDIKIHSSGWVDEMEEAIERDPNIGVLGLKRKDLRQTPHDPDPDFRSELIQLPHKHGERWVVVERSRDIMGTCTMLNWRLIDKVGGYATPYVYSFDDTMMNLRSILAGFYNAFLPHIELDHIDRGDNGYVKQKQEIAAQSWPEYHKWHQQYIDGVRPLYETI
jgi:GT2 family glycosyltransferase